MGGRTVTDADRRIVDRAIAALFEAGVPLRQAAKACGISYQQFKKYRAGQNRMSVGMLQAVADLSGRSAGDFFDPPSARALETEAAA